MFNFFQPIFFLKMRRIGIFFQCPGFSGDRLKWDLVALVCNYDRMVRGSKPAQEIKSEGSCRETLTIDGGAKIWSKVELMKDSSKWDFLKFCGNICFILSAFFIIPKLRSYTATQMAWQGFSSTNVPNSYAATRYEKRWSLSGIKPMSVSRVAPTCGTFWRTLYRLSYTAAAFCLLNWEE